MVRTMVATHGWTLLGTRVNRLVHVQRLGPVIVHGHAFDMPDLALQLGGGDAHGNRALGLSTVRAIAKRCEEAHNSVSRRKGLNLGCRYVLTVSHAASYYWRLSALWVGPSSI